MNAALVQFKPRKGDVAANLAAMGDVFAQLAPDAPDLVVFPEAALTGYFLEGAVYELALECETMARAVDERWRANASHAGDVVVGFYENVEGTFHNSAMYVRCGEPGGPRIVHVHRKMFLPTYGVFDEERFLTRGRRLSTFESAFGTAAILICEDAWHALMPTVAALKGARLLIVPSASPGRGLCSGDGELESNLRWKAILSSAAAEHGVYVLYAGLVGFEGGKGMSGGTCAYSPRGELLASAGPLDACIVRVTLDRAEVDLARAMIPLLGDLSAVLPDLWLDEEIPVLRRLEDRA